MLIATQVGSEHWFYFFILWWTPYVLISLFGEQEKVIGVREPRRDSQPDVDLVAARQD